MSICFHLNLSALDGDATEIHSQTRRTVILGSRIKSSKNKNVSGSALPN